MINRCWISLLFGITGALVGAEPIWSVTGTPVPGLTNVDQVMQSFLKVRNIPRGQLAITYRGRLVYDRAYTWMPAGSTPTQPHQLFRIASLAKPLTAIGMMRLMENGTMQMDDRLGKYLELGDAVDPRWTNITLRHLLQHRGGWSRDRSADPMFQDHLIADSRSIPLPIPQSAIFAHQKSRPLDFAPGSEYAYSNLGYMLLGRVIAQHSGTTYERFMQQSVLRAAGAWRARLGRSLPADRHPDEPGYSVPPGGIARSVFDKARTVPWPDGGWNLENMDAHGGWISTMSDLVRVISAMDDPANSPLLSKSSIDRLWGRPVEIPPTDAAYYAAGWLVRPFSNGTLNAWHDGSLDGTRSYLVRLNRGITWALVFNQRELPGQDDYGIAADIAINNVLLNLPDGKWPGADLFDSDNDGILDSWEREFFGGLANGKDYRSMDSDEDGFSDALEYAAVMNPKQPDSDGPLSIRTTFDGHLEIHVEDWPGREYTVNELDLLKTDPQEPNETEIWRFVGTGSGKTKSIVTSARQRFFRLSIRWLR